MIKLPKDWKEKIQFREFFAPVNQYREVAVMLLILKNDDKQMWAYEQTVLALNDNGKKMNPKAAYNKMLYAIPMAAAQTERVLSPDGYEQYDPITNDNWQVFIDSNLKLYKQHDLTHLFTKGEN